MWCVRVCISVCAYAYACLPACLCLGMDEPRTRLPCCPPSHQPRCLHCTALLLRFISSYSHTLILSYSHTLLVLTLHITSSPHHLITSLPPHPSPHHHLLLHSQPSFLTNSTSRSPAYSCSVQQQKPNPQNRTHSLQPCAQGTRHDASPPPIWQASASSVCPRY